MWWIRSQLRAKPLVEDVRAAGCAGPGWSGERRRPDWAGSQRLFDPDVCSPSGSRDEAPTYKRLTLMLRDAERLEKLLLDADRPIQLIARR